MDVVEYAVVEMMKKILDEEGGDGDCRVLVKRVEGRRKKWVGSPARGDAGVVANQDRVWVALSFEEERRKR